MPRAPQQPLVSITAQQRIVRDAVGVAYKTGGREGVARLLGDDIMRAVSGPLGGPITFETVVMLLIAAFAIFVLIDALF